MRLRSAVLILFTVSIVLAQAPPPSEKPLNKNNILELLRNDVPSERLADLVERYGIDFELTDDYVKTLREAGAKDVLLKALRSAKRVDRRGKPGTTPAGSATGKETLVKEHLTHAHELAIN